MPASSIRESPFEPPVQNDQAIELRVKLRCRALIEPLNDNAVDETNLGGIATSSAIGSMVRLSPGLFQPIAADDVAAIVADVALAPPRNGIVEIAGPERAPFNEIVVRYLKALGDPRAVVSDPEARYYGGRVEERSLVPLGEARLGRIGLDEWLRRSQARA
jgi:hypothetical protein